MSMDTGAEAGAVAPAEPALNAFGEVASAADVQDKKKVGCVSANNLL